MLLRPLALILLALSSTCATYAAWSSRRVSGEVLVSDPAWPRPFPYHAHLLDPFGHHWEITRQPK